MQFIEGDIEKNISNGDDDGSEDDVHISDLNEENNKGIESLHLQDQVAISNSSLFNLLLVACLEGLTFPSNILKLFNTSDF